MQGDPHRPHTSPAGGATPRVSFVVITANRPRQLHTALSSLGAGGPGPTGEIVIVDNGSTGGKVSEVSRRFPGARLVRLAQNQGVAAGRNVGAKAARGRFLVFIDDDATLETPDIGAVLLRRFEANPRLAVVAFKIVNHSSGEVLAHEFPRRDHSPLGVEREQAASYFIGCGFAVRRDLFAELGGFYAEMRYALEEVDLSYRLLDRGYEILYCPEIAVRHMTSPAERRDDRWYFHMMRSRIILVLRNLPWWAALPHMAIWHAGLFLHALLHRHLRGCLRGFADGWRMAPAAWATRRAISFETAKRIWSLAGRLFY